MNTPGACLPGSYQNHYNNDTYAQAERIKDLRGLILMVQEAHTTPAKVDDERDYEEYVIGTQVKREDVIEQCQ